MPFGNSWRCDAGCTSTDDALGDSNAPRNWNCCAGEALAPRGHPTEGV